MRLALALVLGFLVGIERGWSLRENKEGVRTAGIRTFTLIALAGALWGMLAEALDPIVLGFVFLGFFALVITGYYRHSAESGSTGLTTEMAALITFTLGVAVMQGYESVSVMITIVMVLILSVKSRLHQWIDTIESRELYSGIVFLLISAVVMPLLPNRGYGPWEVLNPYEIWGMVVLIAGISYAGYFSMKYLGKERGLQFTSFTGALVSSIAVTVTLGRYSQERRHMAFFQTGVLIATFVALGRILIWVAIFNPAWMTGILPAVGPMMAVNALAAMYLRRQAGSDSGRASIKLQNPLQLSTAAQFGLLLALVMFLAEVGRQWLGEPGLLGVSFLSGLVDIDAIVLSLLQMKGDTLPAGMVLRAVTLAAMANVLVKGAIFVYFSGFQSNRRLVLALALTAGAALPAFMLF